MASFGSDLLAAALAGTAAGEHPLRHVAELPATGRPAAAWPEWAEPDVVRAFADRGISCPWSHQVAAAELAHTGRHVVVSTGHRVGQITGLSTSRPQCTGDRSAGPGAVPVTDEGARA